jgi:hypothetical protein
MVAAYDNSRCEEGPPFVVTCEMNSESKKSYRPLQVRSVMIIYIIKPLADRRCTVDVRVRADTKLRVRLRVRLRFSSACEHVSQMCVSG